VLRSLSLRFRLVLLVAGTMLPLIIFSAAIVYLNYKADRKTAADRVLEVTRGMMLAVDRELQGIVAALQVLALSEPLRDGDLAGFRRQAETYLSQQRPGSNLVLSDRTKQIINLRVPPGELLPILVDTETVGAVYDTARPAISNLRTGPVLRRLIVTVHVPVIHDGRVVYSLSINPTLDTFSEIIQQQRPPEDWVISVFDRAGVNVARTPNPGRFVGTKASPSLYPQLLSKNEGVIETTSLEGTPLLTAFSRSPSSGWSVAAGIPRNALTQPLWRSVATTIAIGLFLLLLGLAFAVRMATRIARAEALRELLINELNHRVKNTLTTVQSIAARTLRGSTHAEAVKTLESRLIALSRTHNVLSETNWESADLDGIAAGALEPYASRKSSRVDISGPSVQLRPRAALTIAMVLHELATNAIKYGALASPSGRVSLTWGVVNGASEPRLQLIWREDGGPIVEPPQRKGFGSSLIEAGIAHEFNGTATLSFNPSGVVCTMEFPLKGAHAQQALRVVAVS
jgi:two-component sensor histidine kinase